MNVPEEEDVRAAFLRHDGIEDAEVCALLHRRTSLPAGLQACHLGL